MMDERGASLLRLIGFAALMISHTVAVAAPLPPVHMFFDSSASMAGYITGSTEIRPLGDLAELGKAFAHDRNQAVKVYCFGDAVAAFPGDPAIWGTRAAYLKPPVAACGNQNSRIDTALGAIRALPADTLAVLVSDFWLDAKSFAGGPEVALGIPMKGILNDRSVMMIGVQVPFSGTVNDFPGVGNYRDGKQRVLVIMLAGPVDKVTAFADTLSVSGSKSFAAMRRTLFRLPVTVGLPTPKPTGAGVRAAKNGREFSFDWDAAARPSAPGRLMGSYDLNALPLANISVWRGGVLTGTKLERRTVTGWQPYTLTGNTWQVKPGTNVGLFAFGTHLGSIPEGVYRLTGQIGTDGVLPKGGDPAAQWMRDWSLEAKPRKPALVKVKGLGDLAGLMEQAVVRKQALGRFETIVTIED